MLGISRLPQNWAAKMAEPLVMPKMRKLVRKVIWLARPTEATAVSPIWPIMMTSMAFRAEATKFWMMMGTARVSKPL